MKIRVMRREVDVDVSEIFRLWGSDLRNDEVAIALGLTRGQMWSLSRRLKLPQRPDHLRAWTEQTGRQQDDPTPEEIAERAAEVRAGWDDATRATRTVGRVNRRYEIPAFRCSANSAGRHVSFARVNHEF